MARHPPAWPVLASVAAHALLLALIPARGTGEVARPARPPTLDVWLPVPSVPGDASPLRTPPVAPSATVPAAAPPAADPRPPVQRRQRRVDTPTTPNMTLPRADAAGGEISPPDEAPPALALPAAPAVPATTASDSLPGAPAPRPVAGDDAEGVVAAAYRENPPPPYPAAARRRQIEGVVRLAVLVGEDGRARAVQLHLSSGADELDDAARTAVGQWRFRPATREGRGVEMWVQVPIRFSLASTRN